MATPTPNTSYYEIMPEFGSKYWGEIQGKFLSDELMA